MQAGVDGLLARQDAPAGQGAGRRRSGSPRLVRLTHEPPPHEATHWTARAMAKAAGARASRRCRRSGRPTASRRIAGGTSSCPTTRPSPRSSTTSSGSMSIRRPMPWCCSVDEKSQIQALDRTQPGLPMKKGRGGTMTHDYKRHGTTTLFAALNVLDGTVIGQKHAAPPASGVHPLPQRARARDPGRARSSTRSSTTTPRTRPRRCGLAGAPSALDLPLHADLELLAQRRRGLLRQAHPAAAEARRLLLRRRPPGRHQPLRRTSTTNSPKPFVWRADPDAIIAARNRGFQALESIH